MHQDERTDQRDIVEQLPYLNELMVAIRNVNDAILNNKDSREAAENLISDLPYDWIQEIGASITKARNIYNITMQASNIYLTTGCTPKQKYNAQKSIYIAGNDYARNIKMIVISLLKEKDLLFKTRAKIETNSMSLHALGEIDDEE